MFQWFRGVPRFPDYRPPFPWRTVLIAALAFLAVTCGCGFWVIKDARVSEDKFTGTWAGDSGVLVLGSDHTGLAGRSEESTLPIYWTAGSGELATNTVFMGQTGPTVRYKVVWKSRDEFSLTVKGEDAGTFRRLKP